MRLYVGNLPRAFNEETVKKLIEKQGQAVERVHLLRDSKTEKSRGMAFVDLTSGTDTAALAEALDRSEVEGRRIVVYPLSASGPATQTD